MQPISIFRVTIALFLIPCYSLQNLANADGIMEIAPARIKRLDDEEIARTVKLQSLHHADGGYLANSTVVDCFADMSYIYSGGRYENETIRFRLRSPDTLEPGKTYPLLIWLHGDGESGDDNQRQLAHMQSIMGLLAGKNQRDFYLLATQCPGDNRVWDHSVSGEGKGDAPLTITKEILDEMLRKYPIDANRISVVGTCSGSGGAWAFLRDRPESVAGIAVFSTSPPDKGFWKNEYNNTPVWAFNNRDDGEETADAMRAFVERTNANGGLAYLTERPKGGHNSWTRAMREDNVAAWLLAQNRATFSPPPGIVLPNYEFSKSPFCFFALPLLLSLPLTLAKTLRHRRRNIRT